MTEIVVIIHRTSSQFHDRSAKYAIAQAIDCGYRVIVVSDDERMRVTGCEYYNISDFSAGAEKFAQIYRHISVNDAPYELFCFQRWFVLKEVMEKIEHDGVWAIDSDVLVFPGLSDLRHFANQKMWNIPHTNFFRTAENLKFFTDFCERVFSDEELMSQISTKFTLQPHISDMLLFYEIGYRFPSEIPDINSFGQFLGVDGGVKHTRGFAHVNAHKTFKFIDRIPYCARDIGGEIRYYTMHFQGLSKPLMQVYNTIKSPLLLDNMEDLSYYFSIAGHDKVEDLMEVKGIYENISPFIS